MFHPMCVNITPLQIKFVRIGNASGPLSTLFLERISLFLFLECFNASCTTSTIFPNSPENI